MARIKEKRVVTKKPFKPPFNYGYQLAKSFLKGWSRYLSLFFLFLILVGAFAVKPQAPQDPLQKEFGEIKTKLVKDPKNPDLHLSLAQIYREVNNLPKAKEEILKALQYSPQNIELQETLKEIKALEEKPQEIKKEIERWEETVFLYPNYRDVWFRLSILYWQIFEEEKAKFALEKTLEIDPGFEPAQKFKNLL